MLSHNQQQPKKIHHGINESPIISRSHGSPKRGRAGLKKTVTVPSTIDLSHFDTILNGFNTQLNHLKDALETPHKSQIKPIPVSHFDSHNSISQIRGIGIELSKVIKQFPLMYKRNGYNPVVSTQIKPKLRTLAHLIDQLTLNVLVRPIELGATIREIHICSVIDLICLLNSAVCAFVLAHNSSTDQHPLLPITDTNNSSCGESSMCDSLFNSSMAPKINLMIQQLPTNNAEAVVLKWKSHLELHDTVALELSQIKLDILEMHTPVVERRVITDEIDFDEEFDDFETPKTKVLLNTLKKPVVHKQTKLFDLVDQFMTCIHSLTKQFTNLIKRIGFYHDMKINHSCYLDQHATFSFELTECIESVHMSLMNLPLPKPNHIDYLDFYTNLQRILDLWFAILTPPNIQHVDSWLIHQLIRLDSTIGLENVSADSSSVTEFDHEGLDDHKFDRYPPERDVSAWVKESIGKLKRFRSKINKTLPKPKV